MCSSSASSFFKTVTSRLTLRYAILITLVSVAFFGIISLALTKSLAIRMDEDLTNEIREMETIYHVRGIEELRRQIDFEIESEGTNRMFIRVMDPRGEVLVTTDMSSWGSIHPPGGREDLREGDEVIETLQMPGKSNNARVASKRIAGGGILQIGSTLQDDEELMEVYREGSALAVMIMLVSGGVMGWFMARRAMAGVERVTRTAVSIGKADLVSRVPLGNEGEEINNLAQAFNDMLERIRGVVTELKDVTNHIAHDLRSPLTRIRGIAETTMTGRQQTVDDYREMAEIVVEESDRLVGMINVMLDIAMTEAGVQDAIKEDVNISRLIESTEEIFQAIAEDKGVAFQVNVPRERLFVRGNLPQLQRMISNLLDNAFKFTPAGGSITLSLEERDTHAVVVVADTGIGIADQDLPRVFEQFYRGDRSRTTPGNGLGLSHVKAIVHAHKGDIRVESTPAQASVFTVILPLTVPVG